MMLSHDSIDRFLKSLSVRGASEDTIKAYKGDLSALHREAGDTDVADLEHAAASFLTAYRNDVAPATTKRRCATYRSFAKWARIEPFLTDYRLPEPASAKPHPIPEGIPGVIAMLNAADLRRHQAVVALCGLVGVRVEESVRVRPEDVDLTDRSIYVKGKGSKDRVVYFGTEALKWLTPAIETALALNTTLAGGLSNRQARRVVTNLGVSALGHHVASHDLRATCATAMAENGVHLRVIQEHLGHAQSTTTEIYTEASEKKMRAAAEVA